MSFQIEIAPEYGYVLLSGLFTWFVHHFLGFGMVGMARNKYKVPVGFLYEPPRTDGDKITVKSPFNWIQRGHMNMVENLPTFFFLLLTAGVFNPTHAAICGFVYAIGRLVYAYCYSIDPKYRGFGELIFMPAEYYLAFIVGRNGWRMSH